MSPSEINSSFFFLQRMFLPWGHSDINVLKGELLIPQHKIFTTTHSFFFFFLISSLKSAHNWSQDTNLQRRHNLTLLATCTCCSICQLTREKSAPGILTSSTCFSEGSREQEFVCWLKSTIICNHISTQDTKHQMDVDVTLSFYDFDRLIPACKCKPRKPTTDWSG